MGRALHTSSLLRGLLLLILTQWSTALDVAYCSPDNNSGGSRYLTSIYMSNGKCGDNCRGSYAFAVVQGVNCYCSNEVPGNQVSTRSCNSPCPGFPSDLCGNQAAGLWGYLDVGGTPTGTSNGDDPSASSSPSSAEPSSTLVASSIESESSSASPLSSSSPTQVYTSVISVTGGVRTVVITPTASASDSALGQNAGGGGLSGGKVAGIVIGAALGIGLIVGLGVFIWLRKRHKRSIDAISEGGSYTSPSNASKNGLPSRQVSQMSSAGLLAKIPRIHTGGFSLHDDLRSAGTSNSNQDRNSTHLTVDQRLNPWAIYSNEDSRHSNVSLQDNQDYSRQLRVANPDP